jgi:hypothetical protein
MIAVRIVKEGYGHTPGDCLTLCEFEAGHLIAFGYAVPYEPQGRECAVDGPLEIRPIEMPVEIMGKRRGRPKKCD